MAAGELSRLLDQDGDGAIGDEAAERAERAEIARAQAESDAAEGERRLQVARQQFAEYAVESDGGGGAGFDDPRLLAVRDGVGSAELTKKVLEIKETMDVAEAEARAMASDASKDAKKAGAIPAWTPRRWRPPTAPAAGALAAAAAADDLDDGAAEDRTRIERRAALYAAAADLDFLDELCRARHISRSGGHGRAQAPPAAGGCAPRVSEYTDKVDVLTFRSKTQRITKQRRRSAPSCAVWWWRPTTARGRSSSRTKTSSTTRGSSRKYLREIGRRHKVMNPEKMRSEYGKMIYLLQDSQMSDVQELLNFKLVKPMRTAHALLAEKNGLAMLRDGLMHQATAEIMHEGKPRIQVQRGDQGKGEGSRTPLAAVLPRGPEQRRS